MQFKFLKKSLFLLLAITFTICTSSKESLSMQVDLAETAKMAEKILRAEKERLRINIKLNKSTFKLNDTAKLSLNLKNVGDSTFYLYKRLHWGVHGSLKYWILDKNCELVARKYFRHIKAPMPSFNNNIFAFPKKEFVKLEKDKSIVTEKFFDIADEGIEKPGKYTLVVFYQSPISDEYAPKELKVWTREIGQIKSNVVTFTVTK